MRFGLDDVKKNEVFPVTSSVMRFEKDGISIIYWIHQVTGFSEDTLRTLVAADSGLMVIDVAKGVEEQTQKLLKCVSCAKPVIAFVNKLIVLVWSPWKYLTVLKIN